MRRRRSCETNPKGNERRDQGIHRKRGQPMTCFVLAWFFAFVTVRPRSVVVSAPACIHRCSFAFEAFIGESGITFPMVSPVTSKPASRGRIKTGQSEVVNAYQASKLKQGASGYGTPAFAGASGSMVLRALAACRRTLLLVSRRFPINSGSAIRASESGMLRSEAALAR